ncbi:MAG: transporter [Marmoricola sp.]|nr:transporter [Marmoricola sp.]
MKKVHVQLSALSRWVRPELLRELFVGILIVVLAVAVPVVTGDLFWQQTMLLACIYVIAAAGLDILRSQAGQMSFGQGAVVGVAAYATALASTAWELPAPLPILIGLAAGMVFGLILALPSLRVQGYYLGFVTMAGALALPQILFLFKDQTRAMTGVNVLPSAIHETVIGTLDWLTIAVIVATIASITLIAVVQSSRWGRQMLLAGESPEAASTLGLSAGRLRLQAFALASATASVAGVLYVAVIQYVAPGSFTLALSIMLYFVVIIGGPGTVIGPIAGVVVLYLFPDHALASLIDYRLLIYGVIAFAVMFLVPDGIAGGLRRLVKRLGSNRRPTNRGTISLQPILGAAPSGERAAPSADDSPLLIVDSVSRHFGSVRALDEASLEVQRGTLHAIVGPNGSGKTTLLNAISGLVTIDRGSITFDGHDVSGQSATARARRGMARTFQKPRVLSQLSVWENIDTGSHAHQPIPWIEGALAGLQKDWEKVDGGSLPHGQRRFLEVLRALRQGPSLIALDEPAAGLSHAERVEFGRLLRDVVQITGISVLMVEHDLELVWGSADVISVVDSGRVIATGTPAELRNSPTIAHLFAGVHHVAG